MVCLFEHFFQQTCALRPNEGDLPALRSKGAGVNRVVLKERTEQKGCQHASGAIRREITKKEILNNLLLSFNIIISNRDIQHLFNMMKLLKDTLIIRGLAQQCIFFHTSD